VLYLCQFPFVGVFMGKHPTRFKFYKIYDLGLLSIVNKLLDISIFPNGRLYEMNGEVLEHENVDKIWSIIYSLAKEGKVEIFE